MPLPALLLSLTLGSTPDAEIFTDREPISTSPNRVIFRLILNTGTHFHDLVPTSRDQRESFMNQPTRNDRAFLNQSELAFRYQYVALLGMNLLTWDGRIVLHAGRSWMAIPPDTLRRATQAGLQLPPPPITYTVPPAAVLVSLALGGYAWSRWRGR